ncbi:CotH kinase family protein [Lacinutrix salivirga]
MKQFTYLLCSVLLLLKGINGYAQQVIAEQGSFGIDTEHKIIVWHISDLESLNSTNNTITSIKFDKEFFLEDASEKLAYSKSSSVKGDYTLYLTKFPLVHITIDTSTINNDVKKPGYFTFYNNKEYIESVMGVRHRGNLSLTFPKKSFDLEFWTDSVSKQNKDVKFLNMRSDDDWILDGMYNEPLRLRSYIATKLWTKIHTPYYAAKEPKAKSGFDIAYVEVFKNNTYYGLYQLSESVDRKQLKLKKNKGNTVRGELFKANSYKGGPAFKTSPKEYNNLFPHWNGWRTEYPFIDYTSEFGSLAEFTNLVVHGSDDAFIKHIERHVNIDNAIDYYLMVNMVRASDNLGKNYYLAKYNTDEPYFFVAWDLDGVMGIIQDGKRERFTHQILGNGLFNRLIELDPNGYNEKLKARWKTLRSNAFSEKEILSSVSNLYTSLTEDKVYEREQLVWINKLNELPNEDHYEYLKTWLEERFTHLDAYFNGL